MRREAEFFFSFLVRRGTRLRAKLLPLSVRGRLCVVLDYGDTASFYDLQLLAGAF